MSKKDGLEFDITKEPQLKRRFMLWSHQWIGLPLLLAIPVLGLTGVLSESSEKIEALADAEKIEIRGEYPSKLHYGKPEQIELTVANKSSAPIRELDLRFESSYLRNFSEVSFIPPIDEGYVMRLRNLKPGESRHLVVSVKGEKYGWHTGKIDAAVAGRAIASIDLKSFVFP